MLKIKSFSTPALTRMAVRLRHFRDDEAGVTSIDFVTVAAVLAGLGILVVSSVEDGTTQMASSMDNQM